MFSTQRITFILLYGLAAGSSAFSQEPKLVLPIGHTGAVNYSQFSPDGKKIVTVSADKTVKIWDVLTGSMMADLKKHRAEVKTAQFSADGKKVITASNDSTAKIWDAVSGKLLLDLKEHHDFVTTASFNFSGEKIVTTSFDSTAIIWEAATGKLLFRFKGHKDGLLSAQFSPDDKRIVTASGDKTAKIWDAENGRLLLNLTGHQDFVWFAQYSPDGKKIVTVSFDKTAKIWDATNGTLLANLKGHTDAVTSAQFSPDGTKLVTASADKTARLWNSVTGSLLFTLKQHTGIVNAARFSPDGNRIVTASDDFTAVVWDVMTGKVITEFQHEFHINAATFSPDGTKIVTSGADNSAIIWDVASGKILVDLLGHSSFVSMAQYSPDQKEIITASADGTVRIWDAATGSLFNILAAHDGMLLSAQYSPACAADPEGGRKFVTASIDSTAKIWDNSNGQLLFTLKHKNIVRFASFSPDARKVVTASADKSIKIWSALSGKLLLDIRGHKETVLSAKFSPDGKKIISSSEDMTTRIWEAATGKQLFSGQGDFEDMYDASFSPDGKYVVATSGFTDCAVLNVATKTKLFYLEGHDDIIYTCVYSPDGKRIVTASKDNTAKIWDAVTGKELITLAGHEGEVTAASFSPDGKKIVTSSSDNTCKVWNAANGQLLYTFIGIDYDDYLVVDKDNRYDGSQAARGLLYFNCAGEVIELDQVKDQLWVPGLAERINKGEAIHAKTLAELNIFNLTPEVKDISTGKEEYRFSIKLRKGGLGDVLVFVNGIEAKHYKPAQLKKNTDGYELVISNAELRDYFIPGKENPVTVRAYTSDNVISSRGVIVTVDQTKETAVAPNLYAVMVGVSDYKGDELDLKYAAKDAGDISAAIGNTAKKLLNTDGKEHVFMYNLTTDANRYQLPEKNSIKKLLEEIGKKATANDILLIFFAGHGVMSGQADQKQFYFLTADASTLSSTGAVADVGISTNELTDWINPQHIKAQKRILIFDACNSGQAIKDFVKMGNDEQQFIAARDDDKSQQVKAIDKLNEKAGLFILSASASNQSAYEMGRYSQGLLTYSLLKAIKEQPDILENGRYLDISRWFNAAEKTVTEISKESGARQEPQIVTNTNFNIGIVDADVLSKIILPQEKPVFTASNFQNNDEAAGGDDLDFNRILNRQLKETGSVAAGSRLVYMMETNTPDACTISGRYSVKDEAIVVKVSIRKNREVKYRFEVSGTTEELAELAAAIVSKAADWAAGNK